MRFVGMVVAGVGLVTAACDGGSSQAPACPRRDADYGGAVFGYDLPPDMRAGAPACPMDGGGHDGGVTPTYADCLRFCGDGVVTCTEHAACTNPDTHVPWAECYIDLSCRSARHYQQLPRDR